MSKLNATEKKYLVERMECELRKSFERHPVIPKTSSAIKESLQKGVKLPVRSAAAIQKAVMCDINEGRMGFQDEIPLDLVFEPTTTFVKHRAALEKKAEQTRARNKQRQELFEEARDQVMLGQGGTGTIKELVKQLKTVK